MSGLPPKADIAKRRWDVRFVPEEGIQLRPYPAPIRLDYSLPSTNLMSVAGAKRSAQFTSEDVSCLITPRKYPRKQKRRQHQPCSRGGHSRAFVEKSIACLMIFPEESGAHHSDVRFSMSNHSGEGKRPLAQCRRSMSRRAIKATRSLPNCQGWKRRIDVKLANGVLTIRGEKRDEKEEKKNDYYVRERSFGSFERSFQVPENVDTDKVSASFKKGVLTVMLPKSAEAQKAEKKIEVKGG
jgi:Hsp20/alpha crystallin family